MDFKKRRGPDSLRAAIWTTSELFGHIISSALYCTHTHGLYSDRSTPKSVFCHLMQHLRENENNIIELLSCERSELFLRHFKNSLNGLIKSQFVNQNRSYNVDILCS